MEPEKIYKTGGPRTNEKYPNQTKHEGLEPERNIENRRARNQREIS